MKIITLALVALLVVGCGGRDAGGTPGRDVGAAVDEERPDALAGVTDLDPSHWDEGEAWEPPYGSTQRAYGGDVWSTVTDFPRVMNHCASGQRRVSWRSLGEPLYAGLTTYPPDGERQTFATPKAPVENVESDGWVDVEATEPATEGELILNACEQPVFRTTVANVLEDFVIEVTEHEPAL